MALAPRQTRTVTLPVEPLVTGAVTVTLYTEHQGVKHFLSQTVTVRVGLGRGVGEGGGEVGLLPAGFFRNSLMKGVFFIFVCGTACTI